MNADAKDTRGEERRRFSRIGFEGDARLLQDDHVWAVNIIDISLNGVLIERPEGWNGVPEQLFTLILRLDKERARIRMALVLVHSEDNRLGLRCDSMDLESVTHLKALLSANSGNPESIRRELAELISPGLAGNGRTAGH